MLAFPKYNVVVSLVQLFVTSNECDQTTIVLDDVNKKYKFDIYVFKSGIVTNIENDQRSRRWGNKTFTFKNVNLKFQLI